MNASKTSLTPKERAGKTQEDGADAWCARCPLAAAIGPTSQLLGVRATDAERYVLETIQQLEARDLVESKDQGGIWFDVYARYRDGRGWFVKVGEDDDGLIVMSHHDPERGAVRTSAGRVIEAIEPAGNAEENHENA
jgi:hypothetical protein